MNIFKFKARARLLEQLGEQLIKNSSIALLELVKNSYDADASIVKMIMRDVDKDTGYIIISDNGCGMDMDIIQNVWLEPGTDHKESQLKQNYLTPTFKRRPLGEKGIGRFAVHKLGEKIELITRKKNKKEILLSFDWDDIKNHKYLDEVSISITEREPEVFINERTGTKITISKIKQPFTREEVRNIYRSLMTFCDPFLAVNSFKVDFDIDRKEWLEDLFSYHDITQYALYHVEAVLEGQEIKKFTYNFNPYPAMDKISKRTVNEINESIKKITKMVNQKNEPVDLNEYNIGCITFSAYIFDREPKILRLGLSDPKGLKEFLNINGGIRVYRDGIRIYDYGEPENDWLELDIRRVNVPARKISNNLILAAIELDREKSADLIEKTNREGFIENKAYFTFKSAILYLLGVIEYQRNIDKEKIRLFYGTKEKSRPVIESIIELKAVIEERIRDEETKNEIIRYLNRIEKEYETINEILLRSAGAGLNLSVAIHEMEKILQELKKIIEKDTINQRIITLIKHLSRLVEGYSTLIRSSNKKQENIDKIIDQAIFNMEYRLEYHNVKLVTPYKEYKGKKDIQVTRNLLLNSIMNILDNSIWWLDYSKKNEDKKIFISLIDKPMGYLSIVIADNGCGFALPPEEIVKPFVSAKPDGMGLGMHIVSEVMKAHNGLMIFPENNDFDTYNIPPEFGSGAMIILAFKKD